jgi:hypothetical protein
MQFGEWNWPAAPACSNGGSIRPELERDDWSRKAPGPPFYISTARGVLIETTRAFGWDLAEITRLLAQIDRLPETENR